jgi:thymidine kinase
MSVEVILGPMFAGKSSAILRMVNRYKCLGWPICIISHSADNRYSNEDFLMNHDSIGVPCVKLNELMHIIAKHEFIDAKLVIIDEAQFFPDLKQFVTHCADVCNKDVLVVGLDGDADRKPFGQILECIPLADTVHKLKAFCKRCGDGTEAIFSYCSQKKTEQVCVGGAEMYMPLCRKHYNEGMSQTS